MSWNEWKNVNKFHLSESVGSNNRFITNLPGNVQECLGIQEATGKAWIGLTQNIIDTAVNE